MVTFYKAQWEHHRLCGYCCCELVPAALFCLPSSFFIYFSPQTDGTSVETRVSLNQNSTWVSNLDGFTNYSISIVAENSKGHSPPSDPHYILTTIRGLVTLYLLMDKVKLNLFKFVLKTIFDWIQSCNVY
jgi:hypothetical protein